ncbi:MAG: pseudouridine synthase [Leptospirales bacterium]
MRIGKYLSRAGICSRREAADFIKKSQVLYKGVLVERLDMDIPESDSLEINGKTVQLPLSNKVYILNKPPGFICSHKEQWGKKSIFRLLPKELFNYYFAGRLDENSRGLVVLSNDGDLVYNLTHPSNKTVKIYHVVTSRPLSKEAKEKMIAGLWDKAEKLSADRIDNLEKPAHYEMELHSGKKRVIRRMIEMVGTSVVDLVRIKMGKYDLDNLEQGKYIEKN